MNMTVKDALRCDAIITEAQLTWKMSALRVRSATHVVMNLILPKSVQTNLSLIQQKRGLHFEWGYVK